MAKRSTKLASFFRPLGEGWDDLVAVKLHRHEIKVAEMRHNSNVINIDVIESAPLARNLQVTRIPILMANLLAADVSVIDTLLVSSTVTKDVKCPGALARIRRKIVNGAPLSTLLSNETVLPITLSQLMAVGEHNGNMDEMLTSIARYCEREFIAVLDGLSTITEPLMIVFVRLLIGAMLVALYLRIS